MSRALDRLLVLLLGLALVALAVLVPVEVVRALTGAAPLTPWPGVLEALRAARWEDGAVLAVAAGTAALGLLLVVLELRPRRPRGVLLQGDVPGVRTTLARRGLQELLASAATTVPGVREAAVALRRRRARVTATTVLRGEERLDGALREAVAAQLDAVRPARAPRLRVRVKAAS